MQVKPFHGNVDLSALKGNKMWQKETLDIPDSQLHIGNPKDILNSLNELKVLQMN